MTLRRFAPSVADCAGVEMVSSLRPLFGRVWFRVLSVFCAAFTRNTSHSESAACHTSVSGKDIGGYTSFISSRFTDVRPW